MSDDLKEALASIVGAEHVDPAGDIEDITENPPGRAEFIVRPGRAEALRALAPLLSEPLRDQESEQALTAAQAIPHPMDGVDGIGGSGTAGLDHPVEA